MTTRNRTLWTTYSIALWDHEIEPATADGGWCNELAARHIVGPSRGLSIFDVRRALQVLLPGWERHMILVVEEN